MEKNLQSIIQEAGIVGAGGAGFPTHVKVNAKAEIVIVNCAECEPLLRVDQQLMEIETKKILEGLSLVVEAVGAKSGVVGLKSKYKNAIASINNMISNYANLSIHELGNFYPAGDEQILVYEITKKVIPEGAIPLSVGAVVVNVETLLNIYNAYYENQPVVEKYLTITGEVKNKMTVKVPLGITVKEAIELAGGTTVEEFVVINGGPMMGKPILEDDVITKTTKGLIVLPKDHSIVVSIDKDINRMLKEAKTSCMHCSLCSEVCPRGLLGHNIHPSKIIRMASYASVCDNKVTPTTSYLCCECRLCEYACVMNLQPWKLNSNIKSTLSSQGIRNDNHNETTVHPFREYRKYPVNKLIARLGIKKYDEKANLININKEFNNVEILLRQHIGAPSTAIVEVGEEVSKNQLIAQLQPGNLGSNIHSSIDGTVVEVSDKSIKIQKKL